MTTRCLSLGSERESARAFDVDRHQYPFASRWLEWRGAWLHYLDEGAGAPVLLLHGNPTWSYLYRKVIREVWGDFRLIVPDYPGFGFSEVPFRYGFTPQEHTEAVATLVERLELKRFRLIAHDWGGPIGASLALRYPEAVGSLVLTNTWCWPVDGLVWLFSLVCGSPLGRYLILRHDLLGRLLLPLGIHHAVTRSRQSLQGYRISADAQERRYGQHVFARQLRRGKEWLGRLEDGIGTLSNKPTCLVWGMRDPAFGKESVIRRWLKHLPAAKVRRLSDASHFVPEDRPDAIAEAIRELRGRGPT